MIRLVIAVLLFYFLTSSTIPEAAVSLDNAYGAIQIGSQTWMDRNWNSPAAKSWWYQNDSVKNSQCGRLYYFSSAVASAPPGWHLPSLKEWQELINHFGGDSLAGSQLIKGSKSSLNLQYGGHKSANVTTNDLFDLKDQYGYYWTSTQTGEQTAYAIEFRLGVTYVTKNYFRKANGFSVRYIKDK